MYQVTAPRHTAAIVIKPSTLHTGIKHKFQQNQSICLHWFITGTWFPYLEIVINRNENTMELRQRITFICLTTHLKVLLACTVCVFNSSYHVALLPSDNIYYLPARHNIPDRFTNKTTAQPYSSTHPLLVAWPCMHGSTEVRFPPPPFLDTVPLLGTDSHTHTRTHTASCRLKLYYSST